MKLLFVFVTILSGCAVAAPVPIYDPPPVVVEIDPCESVECLDGMRCFDYWGAGICVVERRESGFCNEDCGLDAECRFDICVEADFSGIVCEFDSDCLYSEFCIVDHCTELPCSPGDIQPCYYGPVGTEGVGECRAGYHLCTPDAVFTQECIGEVLPASDAGFLACNGVDNNCDGIVDEGGLEAVDLVFGFDISGSMSEYIAAVSEAIHLLSGLYNHSSIRLGLITFPTIGHDDGEYIPTVAVPLSTYTDFVYELGALGWTIDEGGSYEASWDLPVLLAKDLLPEISFRPDAKTVFVMFTDERGQTFFSAEELGFTERNNESLMCRTIQDEGLLLYVVTSPGETYRIHAHHGYPAQDIFIDTDFDDCATIFPLSEDAQDMVDNLSEIADLVCVE